MSRVPGCPCDIGESMKSCSVSLSDVVSRTSVYEFRMVRTFFIGFFIRREENVDLRGIGSFSCFSFFIWFTPEGRQLPGQSAAATTSSRLIVRIVIIRSIALGSESGANA